MAKTIQQSVTFAAPPERLFEMYKAGWNTHYRKPWKVYPKKRGRR